MSKFVIACPSCGKYAEASTGFFARKHIDCACGYKIHVPTDKMTSRDCPHCGNTVVFDQSQGADARCPVCKEPINTMAEQSHMAEIHCGQCGVWLTVNKAATTYTCPVCDHVNDVAERLKREEISREGLISVIKYEGDEDTLVWKHPLEDFNYGSQLIVHESQEAIFFKDGQALDLFGAGRYTLETQQLPLLEKLYKLPTGGHNTFHSEVYYINQATVMGIKWGTDSKVRMFDPASGLHVELGACGEFNIRVANSRMLLLKLVGTTGKFKQEQIMGMGDGKGYFRAMIMTQVKSYLAQAIKACGISILEIDEHLTELSEDLRIRLNGYLQNYGLEMPEFFVTRVITPDEEPNFRRMKEQFAAQYLKVREEQIKKSEAEAAMQRKAVEAQTAAQMQIIGAQGEADALRIRKQAEADAYRMQAEAEAAEMRMKGYTYQQETARQVGLGATMAMATGGSGSGIGEVAGLGMTLGALGSVMGITKEAMSGVAASGAGMGQMMSGQIAGTMPGADMGAGMTAAPGMAGQATGMNAAGASLDTWNCACGTTGITSKFCPECGSKRPEVTLPSTWNCSCGAIGITSKFCPECGNKRPEGPVTWNCACGATGITSKFCPECGNKREG